MLELKNISKQFGQHKIFDNYNLTVEEGKILAIVGPSGKAKYSRETDSERVL